MTTKVKPRLARQAREALTRPCLPSKVGKAATISSEDKGGDEAELIANEDNARTSAIMQPDRPQSSTNAACVTFGFLSCRADERDEEAPPINIFTSVDLMKNMEGIHPPFTTDDGESTESII